MLSRPKKQKSEHEQHEPTLTHDLLVKIFHTCSFRLTKKEKHKKEAQICASLECF